MNQDIFEWLLLLGRWLHITVAVTWIGTSIFFMWLDRTLIKNPHSKKEGHVGELWMVHGGGFYHVEKLLMGPTKVPKVLHWFKWESYWTWLSGVFLIIMIFYTGGGTFLLDESISKIQYFSAVSLGIFSIIGSWFYYDFLWERKMTRDHPLVGHFFTLFWFVLMTYLLCHTLSGRAAYMHIGAMIGTWMTANVFMRIIPRQLKMVEASKKGLPVNQDWGKNAKNRSTHNTYFTLPIIFIMLSNHFPSTYGHEYNWLVLILLTASGACIREYFVKREALLGRAKIFLIGGIFLLVTVITLTKENRLDKSEKLGSIQSKSLLSDNLDRHKKNEKILVEIQKYNVSGVVNFIGKVPLGKKLRLPRACAKQYQGDVYSDEIKVFKGKLENVLVRITKGISPSLKFQIPKEEVTLNQRGCLYSPRVSAVMVGQKVRFLNSDPVFHNVKSITKVNQKFNFALPKIHQSKIKVFNKPEIFLQTKCSLHPWMGSFIAVMANPFFFVTKKNGAYVISGLIPGDYTIEFWHEKLGIQQKKITIVDQSLEININFSRVKQGKNND